MMYTRSAVMCLAVFGCIHAAPHVSKTVILEKQIPAQNEVAGALGASASFGPWSAGAGLGGKPDGGGLYAGAVSPQGSAGAGLGGGSSSSASASASASAGATGSGTAVVKPSHGPGFFDRIFNIPISILQSVNTNLNANGGVIPPRHNRYIPVQQGPGEDQVVFVRVGRRGGVRKHVYVKGGAGVVGHPAAPAPAPGGASSSASASASADAGISDRSAAGASAGANAGAAAGSGQAQVGVHKNYDAVFNIPITALKSVNQFLNGK